MFLKPYSLALSTDLSTEAVQLPMKVRVSEHKSVSPRIGKRVKGALSTSVRDHMFNCDHTLAWEDFSIIGRKSNHYLLETKESLFIKRDSPLLNRNKYS